MNLLFQIPSFLSLFVRKLEKEPHLCDIWGLARFSTEEMSIAEYVCKGFKWLNDKDIGYV